MSFCVLVLAPCTDNPQAIKFRVTTVKEYTMKTNLMKQGMRMLGIALSFVLLLTAAFVLFTAAVFADGRLSATAPADSDQRVFTFHPEDGIPQIGTCKKHNGIEGWDCERAMDENGVERQLYRNFGCVYTNPVPSSDSSLDNFTLGRYMFLDKNYFAGETTKKGKYKIYVLIEQPYFKIQFYVDGKYIGTAKGTKGKGWASDCYWAVISEMADKKLKKKMRKAIRNWKETRDAAAQIEIKAVVIPTGEYNAPRCQDIFFGNYVIASFPDFFSIHATNN
jgi:hypothetical protein